MRAVPELAVVQGDPTNGHIGGFIEWWEHVAAWGEYAKRYGSDQTAIRIHQRGGFSYAELVDQLGHAPITWRPR